MEISGTPVGADQELKMNHKMSHTIRAKEISIRSNVNVMLCAHRVECFDLCIVLAAKFVVLIHLATA